MTTRQKPFDIARKMTVVRSMATLANVRTDDETDSKEVPGEVKVRKLNIPTCSISDDTEYEKGIQVSAFYCPTARVACSLLQSCFHSMIYTG